MFKFRAGAFYKAAAALSAMQGAISALEFSEVQLDGRDDLSPDSRNLILTSLKDFRPELEVLGAPVTAAAALRLWDDLLLKNRPMPYDECARRVIDIQARLRDEMESVSAFVLSPEERKLFEPKDALFGPDVAAKFVSASFDIDEAGKCLALARPTASVFHLMRTLEIAIQAIARCLQIPDPTKPAERNWGFILKGIKGGLDARWPTSADRLSGDGVFFEGLYASLDAVRNPWRNTTMHVQNKYTDDEADHIFRVVRAFMRTLAGRMDENGDPRA